MRKREPEKLRLLWPCGWYGLGGSILIMAQNIDDINGGAVFNIEGKPSESGGLMEGNNKALKKGPWTTAEDQILIDCVRKQGEGNWNSLRRNSRLNRCGKSCRLRWANHLHPNLKKGAFTPEEERCLCKSCRLHMLSICLA